MFYTKFAPNGKIDASGGAGLEYRSIVLGAGGSRTGMELVTEFLGREPNAVIYSQSTP